MRLLAFVLCLGLMTAGVQAAESGCDKFKWPLEADRTLLQAADKLSMESGGALDVLPSKALQLTLQPQAELAFEKPPERAPKVEPAFAGVLRIPALPKQGTYRISLDGDAWIDVIQGGRHVEAADFTGARDCPGLRKSVTFALEAGPVTLQFSGAATESLGVLVTAP